MLGGQTLGGAPIPPFGAHRGMTYPAHLAAANQQYAQQQYMNQVPSQAAPMYGNSPAAQYIAATHAAGAQAGLPGGQVAPGLAGAAPAGGQFNQSAINPYSTQGQPGLPATGGLPVPGAANAGMPAAGAHSYPGAYGYGHHGDYDSPHRGRKKKKSKVRKILEDLLAGTAAAKLAEHERDKHHRRHDNNNPAEPPSQTPPRGSALGFLHPQGHFVPSALDYMIAHFIHGNKDRNLAPEGARTGYLHPGGHFVPMSMERLIEEFKHTLVDRPGHHSRRHRSPHDHAAHSRDVSSSSGSEYTDSDDSDTSSETEEHGRRRARSREGHHHGRH